MRPLIVVALLAAAGGAAAEPLDVERAVTLALERNAEIAVLASDVRASSARLEETRLVFRTNPEVSAAAGPRFRPGETLTDVDIAVAQRVEVFGTRGARIEAARAEYERAQAQLAARRAAIAAGVRQAFARAIAAARLADVADSELALSKEAAGVAARRLELGDGSRLDVNAARVEIGRAARELSLARQRSRAARADLAVLTGGAIEEAVQLVGDLRSTVAPTRDRASLVEEARAGRADLRAARHELEAAHAESRLASREWLPTPRIGAAYKHEEGADVALGSLEFELPVFNRAVAARGVARARVERAEHELAALEQKVQQEVLLAASRVGAARDAAAAFEGDVLGAIEENLTLTTAAYTAGKIRLPELLLMRRSAVEAQRGRVEAQAELAEADAELSRVLGRSSGRGEDSCNDGCGSRE